MPARGDADSRSGLGGWTGTFAPGETRTIDPAANLPTGSRVAVLGVTSTASSGAGFITVQPCGGQAEVSNLNFVGGVDITNLVVVPLSDSGTICVTTSERTHIVVDAFGGVGTDGLAGELTVSGAAIFPEFAPSSTTTSRYCQSLTANQLSVHVRGMPRTTATVGSVGGTQIVDTTLTVPADDAIVVAHHADRRWYFRGVLDPLRTAGLPAHHDFWRRRRPARLVHPRQQR